MDERSAVSGLCPVCEDEQDVDHRLCLARAVSTARELAAVIMEGRGNYIARVVGEHGILGLREKWLYPERQP